MVCITGATGGLGKAFALECAARGWDLYLTDISEKQLKTLATGLMRIYPVEINYDPCDLTDPESRQAFWEQVTALRYRFNMLINVAGLDFEGGFMDRQEDEILAIIRLNIEATVSMTRKMVDFKNQGSTLNVINVSSLAGFYPMPLKAVYAASKRFLLDFSRAMNQELRHSGVRVLALCPAGLATKPETITSITSQGWIGELTTMQVGSVASKTINRALVGRSVFIPGWINKVIRFLGGLLPADLVAWLIGHRWSKTRQIAHQIDGELGLEEMLLIQ